MNEFTGKPLKYLKSVLPLLESYKQGALDTLQVIRDQQIELFDKTVTMYNEKIRQCAEEIRKLENKDGN